MNEEKQKMKPRIFDSFASKNSYPALIGYPEAALKESAKSLWVANRDNPIFKKNQPLQHVESAKSLCSIHVTEIAWNSSVFEAPLMSTIQPDSVIDTICNHREAAAINDSTGIRTGIDNVTKRIFVPCIELPVISPMYWGVLPAETINFYATDLDAHAKIECLN